MKIYKYVGKAGIAILRSKMLKFTPPREFNDPFEMRPYIVNIATDEELQRGFQEHWTPSRLKGHYETLPEAIRNKCSFEQYLSYSEATRSKALERLSTYSRIAAPSFRNQFYEKVNSDIGVLCLTEKRDDLLMWAHYAENHQGFVIEFDRTHPFFHRKSAPNDEFNQLLPVQYSLNRPNGLLAKMDVTDVFLTKSEHWRYECEWRMLCRLSTRTQFQNGMSLFVFPPETITGIILGCRTPEDVELEIAKILESNPCYENVALDKAEPDELEFKLNISPRASVRSK